MAPRIQSQYPVTAGESAPEMPPAMGVEPDPVEHYQCIPTRRAPFHVMKTQSLVGDGVADGLGGLVPTAVQA